MSFKVAAVTGGIVTGIVLGAIGMEVMKKTNPEFVKNVEDKMKDAGKAVKDAFEGNEPVEEA